MSLRGSYLIILVMTFVLLIPLTVFAQSSEKTIAYSVLDATASIFAGFVTLAIPILIISLIVLKKKGKLTGSLFKKILAIFGLFFLALMLTSIISSNFMSDAEKAERTERIAEIEHQEELDRIAQKEKEDVLKRQEAQLEREEDLQRRKDLEAEWARILPASCDGVGSTESRLYPTADQCAEDLGKGFYNWCLEEAKKEVSANDVVTRAGLCMGEIAIRFDQLCEDPVIGSQEFCLMNSMQDLYLRLVVQ